MEEIQQEEKKHNGNDIFHIKEKIYEMILYGNPQLKDFPKTERYVLAGDIRKTMYTMLEMAVRLEKKYHKKTTLQDLDIEVDVLRNLLRLAKDPNLYPNQKPCLNFHTCHIHSNPDYYSNCLVLLESQGRKHYQNQKGIPGGNKGYFC